MKQWLSPTPIHHRHYDVCVEPDGDGARRRRARQSIGQTGASRQATLFALCAWSEMIHSGNGLEAIMAVVSNVASNIITPHEVGLRHVPSESVSASTQAAVQLRDRCMRRLMTTAMALVVTLVCCTCMAAGNPIAGSESDPSRTASGEPFLLAPPKGAGPVVVRARFNLHDINEINDGAETFEFAGVLTLKWHDPRQAFDPAVVGVDEKIFQGAYQFNELPPGWFPQVVLVNESGLYQKNGVVLRVQPDGTSTLIETLNAIAEAEFNISRFPFDGQRLEAVFEVLGFDQDEVVLQVASDAASFFASDVRVPQWTITGASASVRDRPASYAGRRGVSSAFVVSVDVQRESFYMRRLVIIPLVVIVLLSFSVFWMDRSSLGDRLSVSFIGILTGVAYQLVMSEQLPRISYVTLMHGFLNLSFLTMCATVVINLVVGALDQRGKFELGDRIDRRCRWGFPLAYFGLLLVMLGTALLLF
jgi:Neurotransmitter-gated ion-channel ligand binding domain/Neurotransmitter-gated ion-channel transmembrane region